MVEQPEKFGITLLLQAIGTTQGIYGLLVTFLILSKSGILTGATGDLTATLGIQFIAAGLPIGIVGWYSAIAQARVAATSVAVVGKDASLLGKTFIYPAMVETFAVFSLLVSILMWNSIPM
jgi:V/A-type H+-transporting ATPase subunit K